MRNGFRLAGTGRVNECLVRRIRLRATRRRDVVEPHAVRTQHEEIVAHDAVQAVVPVLETRLAFHALTPGEEERRAVAVKKLRTKTDRHFGGKVELLRADHLHAANLRANVALAHGETEITPFVVERGLEREVPFAVQSESALHLLLYACCFPTCRCTLVVPICEHHEFRRAVARDIHRRRAVGIAPEVRERLLRAVPRVPQLGRACGAERAVARLGEVADKIHVVAAHAAVERLGCTGRAEVGRADRVRNRLQLFGRGLGRHLAVVRLLSIRAAVTGELPHQFRDERVNLRLLRMRGVGELRLRAEDDYLAARALECNELLQRRPLDRDHVRHDNHPIRLARHT